MRKELRILCIFLFVLGLAGCASVEDVPEQMITVAAEIEETDVAPEKSSGELVFVYQGEHVIPGKKLPKNMEDAAISSHESSTCVGTGMEILYQYDGFEITVHSSTTSDLVYSIYFQSPDVATAEGLSIGDRLEKVHELYGDATNQGSIAWVYSDGNTELIVLISDNTVVGIEYRMVG